MHELLSVSRLFFVFLYLQIDVLADGEQETKNDGETWLWQLVRQFLQHGTNLNITLFNLKNN